ncbi:MAG: GNAT family N-acetyltransferase [Bacilli bacterium]|nr:GNAT family N-acetyltransferase [Bacilli bacterium]
MNSISLYIPNIEDYWYQEKIQLDPLTMDYNKGYDVNYYGYHYDTGCIDFPKEKWEEEYNKRIKDNRYFAYIKDNNLNEFVGYVNYQFNNKEKRYECGILIEYKHRNKGYSKKALELLCSVARDNGINELYDNFELDRSNALKLFESVGFRFFKEESWKKFNKEVKGVIVKIDLQ